MIKVSVNIEGKYVDVSLQEALLRHDKEAPEGWFLFVKDYIDDAMNIKNKKNYEKYLENNSFVKMITKVRHKFDYLEIKRFYEVLKKSKYNQMFDDDILKYISYIRELSFFDIIGYELDKNNPDLDDWFNSKNAFKYGLQKKN